MYTVSEMYAGETKELLPCYVNGSEAREESDKRIDEWVNERGGGAKFVRKQRTAACV
jgi:hypothetical protein